MSEVVLVFMPYATADRPSIGLGYLKAELARINVEAAIIHANVAWAKKIGIKTYNMLNGSSNLDLLGEWTFSGAAFPDFNPDPQDYFKSLHKEANAEELFRVRSLAADFVEEIAQQVVALKPKFVGCSSMFQQNLASLALLRRVRELDPTIITAMGGANCEEQVGRALHTHFPWVDYVFSGEADETFPLFCSKFFGPTGDRAAAEADLSWLPPSVFSPQTRHLGLDRPTAFGMVTDMDTLPLPDFDDYFQDLERTGLKDDVIPALVLETSRGCWWGEKLRCLFCGLSEASIKFRAKSPENAYQEIKTLSQKYNSNLFELVDNILDTKYYNTLLPALIEAGSPYKFFYEIKANVSRENIRRLADAGIMWVQPGMEGLHDKLLKLMKKGNTACHNVRLLKWCREYGVVVSWNYLCHVPGEQDEWHKEELDLVPLLAHLQAPWNSGTPIRFDRFSAYFGCSSDHNLDLSPSRVYRYIYPLNDEQMREQAYFFEDQRQEAVNNGQPLPIFEQLRESLVEWRKLFYHIDEKGEVTDRIGDNLRELQMTIDGDCVIIDDTRPCAVAPRHYLDGLDALVYQACDAGEGVGNVLTYCREKGLVNVTEEQVRASVASLIERKLMVFISSRYLSLAVHGTPRPYIKL